MVHALGLALIWLAATPSTGTLEFQRVGEVKREVSTTFHHWLDRQRYILSDITYTQTRAGRISHIHILDALEQKHLELPFPQEAFRKAHPGYSTAFPYPLSFFKKDRALLRFDQQNSPPPDVPKPLPRYCFLNPSVQSSCEPRELRNVTPMPRWALFEELGPDPTEKHLYGAIHVYDGDYLKRARPVSLRLFRIPLSDDSLTSDWEVELVLPQREHPLSLRSGAVFSADGKKMVLVEYFDLQEAEHFTPEPPPQAYVIDIETRKIAAYPIPPTSYGVSFSRDGRYLAVGSLETAELIRINLAAGKIDRRVKAGMSIDELATPARGDTFLVFAGRSSKPRPIQVRRWSDLKVVQRIPIRSLFPERDSMDSTYMRMTADGRHMVTTNMRDDGFASTEGGLVIFELKER